MNETLSVSQTMLSQNLISSLILVSAIQAIRILSVRALLKAKIVDNDSRRRWVVLVKNASILLTALGLILIWGTELKTFAVSLVAIAVALVVATKELILCLLGGIVKTSSKSFSIGDRIEIAGIRGDVIDHNPLTTSLFEIGPGRDINQYTGRSIVIPNSLFLSSPLINETEAGTYVLHVFRVPFKRSDNWQAEREKLLQAAQTECDPYLEDARRQFARLGRREGIDTPSTDPRITITYPEADRIDLIVRIPVPARRKGRVEQGILARFAGLEAP